MRVRAQCPLSQHDTPTTATLEQLLSRVANGDEHAFEQVYRNLCAPIFGLIHRILRDPAQSEEVAQEVFLELWRTAARYSAQLGSVRSWAMMIAHRRAVDRVRTARATRERDNKAAHSETVRDFDEVTETVIGNLERHQVRRCLAMLTDVQRESLRLAYYQGYTHRKVSELLDCPLGTIKARLRDGLIRLRECLEGVPQ
nr:ECF RNA polymerase sigma factor SigK [Kibdelosporangium sp. MJ126-NF4]CEL17465.1 RNA polymerase sigma-70 factor [Kibdelosporangium sp. MJ126-NF4]CTQ91308.1 RNA polymerase sigma-70 factor [Kibdelosporangium sp. MJ126-NF4]